MLVDIITQVTYLNGKGLSEASHICKHNTYVILGYDISRNSVFICHARQLICNALVIDISLVRVISKA